MSSNEKNYNKKCTSKDGKFGENNICKNDSKHNNKSGNCTKTASIKISGGDMTLQQNCEVISIKYQNHHKT